MTTIIDILLVLVLIPEKWALHFSLKKVCGSGAISGPNQADVDINTEVVKVIPDQMTSLISFYTFISFIFFSFFLFFFFF